jgi:hypothetical protein
MGTEENSFVHHQENTADKRQWPRQAIHKEVRRLQRHCG